MKYHLLLAASAAALSTSALAQERELSEVVVTAAPFAVSLDSVTTSIDVVSREDLDAAPPAGLGDVLSGLPGLRSSAFGPGASRPVVRGLAGPRVQVLTNGVGMIDASALSPDHQVAADPGEAVRIEVLRGPAALLYGGSAIGGVVNVIDERIATKRPDDGLAGRIAASTSSVDEGRQVSGSLAAAVGPFVLTIDGLDRSSDDYRIPAYPESARLLAEEGEEAEGSPSRLANSAVELQAYGAGISYVAGEAGFLGLSVKRTDTSYGVPGHSHEGEEAVTIGLEQTRVDLRGEMRRALGPFETVRLSAGWADYTHTEFEGDEVGTRFFSDGYEGRVELVQARRGGWDGAVGVQGLKRDFDAAGDEAYVPRTRIQEIGVFTLQRVDRDAWGYEGGLRIDRRSLDSVVASADFTNISGSAGVFFRPARPWFLGLSVSRTARAPTESELFAQGPHIATHAFEVGDPTLDAEIANSLEAAVHYGSGRLSADLHLFATRYDGFIDLRPTGDEEDHLPVFAYVQTDADFHGFEAEGAFKLTEALSLEAGADYVKASSDLGPVARVPPWSVTGRIVYDPGPYAARIEVRRVGEQERVADFELPTDAYTLLNAGFSWKARKATFHVEGRNLTNQEAREHVSFLKDLAPLPGRSLRAGLTWDF